MKHQEPSHVIQVEDRFYILATSSMADDRTRVLKHGDTFAVFDRYGDIQPIGLGEHGIYHGGTRHLSQFGLWLGSERPLLLSSTVRADNTLLVVDLTNLDLHDGRHLVVPHGHVHVFRSKFLWGPTCFERLRVTNFSQNRVRLPLVFTYEADFADIFEVRGARRERRGAFREPEIGSNRVTLTYEGLDGTVRRTRISCSPQPNLIDGTSIRLTLDVDPGTSGSVHLHVNCDPSAEEDPPYDDGYAAVVGAARETERSYSQVTTGSEQFNGWLSRSVADLRMMMTTLPEGPYPFAGVPWFSAPFGRDGIVTALSALWVDPDIARGVLTYLAATQATAVDPDNDAEPGKILHETRTGEMAILGEIPFRRYFGSVDATPLFVMLAGAYHRATADAYTLRRIWPNIERALEWIDTYGDLDDDGFVEYERHSEHGLVNQGWKDSHDSIFHADGSQATGPIALAEVQGYVYAARREAAILARTLGIPDRADALEEAAEALRARFDEAFWCPEIGTYAIALDGRKRPCRVRTSNAGLCLFSGIASEQHAELVAQELFSEASYSGWGIRTVAATEAGYNPMSYHNGSIWPHDNAMIAAGLARYGHVDLAMRVLEGLFDAAVSVDQHRLPELFCGFHRRGDEGPVMYPVACSPQAWASAAVFLLVRAVLGLDIDAAERIVRFDHPMLPRSLGGMRIAGLRVGGAVVDLEVRSRDGGATVDVLRREGDVRVVAVT